MRRRSLLKRAFWSLVLLVVVSAGLGLRSDAQTSPAGAAPAAAAHGGSDFKLFGFMSNPSFTPT